MLTFTHLVSVPKGRDSSVNTTIENGASKSLILRQGQRDALLARKGFPVLLIKLKVQEQINDVVSGVVVFASTQINK